MLLGQPPGLGVEALQLMLQMLDARPLDLGALLGGTHPAGVLFPALLPLLQRLLGGLELRCRRALGALHVAAHSGSKGEPLELRA